MLFRSHKFKAGAMMTMRKHPCGLIFLHCRKMGGQATRAAGWVQDR
jgi:hypothetical protein